MRGWPLMRRFIFYRVQGAAWARLVEVVKEMPDDEAGDCGDGIKEEREREATECANGVVERPRLTFCDRESVAFGKRGGCIGEEARIDGVHGHTGLPQ